MRTASYSNGSATELVLLGLLAEERMHGYELKRRIDTAFGAIMTMSWGSLYPALAKLERRGFIGSATGSSQRTRFDPRQLSGALAAEFALLQNADQPALGHRNRKVYTITQAGQEALDVMLRSIDIDDDRAFWFALAFSTRLDEDERLSLLERRLSRINERIRDLRQVTTASPGLRQVRQGLEYRLDAEQQWIERELKSLREHQTLSR
jgi:DNA-binding PadR family transcriptional regulator